MISVLSFTAKTLTLVFSGKPGEHRSSHFSLDHWLAYSVLRRFGITGFGENKTASISMAYHLALSFGVFVGEKLRRHGRRHTSRARSGLKSHQQEALCDGPHRSLSSFRADEAYPGATDRPDGAILGFARPTGTRVSITIDDFFGYWVSLPLAIL